MFQLQIENKVEKCHNFPKCRIETYLCTMTNFINFFWKYTNGIYQVIMIH